MRIRRKTRKEKQQESQGQPTKWTRALASELNKMVVERPDNFRRVYTYTAGGEICRTESICKG
jgi:hypothetical protein